MQKSGSFLVEFAELIERHRHISRYQATKPEHVASSNRILRWFIPNGGTLILIALLIATQSIWAQPFAATNAPGPSATTVNYQGRLADNLGTPLDGSYGMSFALYDAASAGNLVWGPEVHDAVPVSDGLFSVGLGSRTAGGIPTTTWNGDRYLEITVGGETLSPRELIRSVPIAGMALTVPDGAIGSSQIADGAVGIAQLEDEAFVQAIQNASIHWSDPVAMETDVYKPFSDVYISVDVQQPSKLLLMASGVIEVTGGNGNLYAGFQRNGVQLGQTHRRVRNAVTDEIWSWNYVDTVTPGSYTYQLEAKGIDGMEIRWYRPAISLIVIPIKE
jgi:hypothetical protein